MFQINPSISFFVTCRTVARVDEIWAALAQGGSALMELGEYPFSKRFGWLQDRYGVSWQIIHSEEASAGVIAPFLMFTGAVCGQAEGAMNFYASIFPASAVAVQMRHEAGEGPDEAGTVQFAQFSLAGQPFAAMDSALDHGFGFNEAVSLIVECAGQAEIDYYWAKLSHVPQAEQCGWLKDKFGVSWQITPANMGELLARNPAQTTPVMLAMKKIVVADLEAAGRP